MPTRGLSLGDTVVVLNPRDPQNVSLSEDHYKKWVGTPAKVLAIKPGITYNFTRIRPALWVQVKSLDENDPGLWQTYNIWWPADFVRKI